MARVSEKMSEKKMDVTEATELMRELAQPVPVKVALFRAGQELKTWSANRIRDVFHGDDRVRLNAQEARELRDATQRKREADGAEEYRQLRARLDRIEELLRASGADLDFPEADLAR